MQILSCWERRFEKTKVNPGYINDVFGFLFQP